MDYAANQIPYFWVVQGRWSGSIFLAVVDPGDKVVFPAPSWNNNHYCDLLKAEAVIIPTRPEHNFMPTAAELAPHLKGAALLALCLAA